MTDVDVRPFRRDDRDQLTALVNAHVQAVVPGATVAVNTVLSQLEREPGEPIVDPWVSQRLTLVAEQRGRVSAAAHLLRYGTGPQVGQSYRGLGELRWVVCWPDAPWWPDASMAGDALASAAVSFLRRSGAARIAADGALPAPGVYGVPRAWPHVGALLTRAGFTASGSVETVLLADLVSLPHPEARLPGLSVERTVGTCGTRLTAVAAGAHLGYVEVDGRSGANRSTGQQGWADVGNLWVEPDHRRRGVGTWLLGQAASWLLLGHVDRLLDYADPADHQYLGFLDSLGFVRLGETQRGWEIP